MLEIQSIHMSYGTHKVLNGVSFDVATGETFALIGPNGAGKTSLFKVMVGEAKPSAGSIRMLGKTLDHTAPHARVHLGMARTFQTARVFLEYTVLENLIVVIESRDGALPKSLRERFARRPRQATLDEVNGILVDMNLEESAAVQAKFLSHGDKKRLELALGLAQHPKILMLDEPTAGMSPGDRRAIITLIQRLRKERNLTIIVSEHDMEVVFGLADRVAVLNYGELIALGSIDDVRRNTKVREVYLGKETYGA